MEDANFKGKQDSGLIALCFFYYLNSLNQKTYFTGLRFLMIMFENKVSLFDAIQIIIY